MKPSIVRGQRGVTLVEVLVSVTLLVSGLSMVAAPLYATSLGDEPWRSGVASTSDLRRAESAVAGDALVAQGTTLLPQR